MTRKPELCAYCGARMTSEDFDKKNEIFFTNFACGTRSVTRMKGAHFYPGWQVKCKKLL
jgi:hypothetical protein